MLKAFLTVALVALFSKEAGMPVLNISSLFKIEFQVRKSNLLVGRAP
jgi:hypothetical protein